MESDMRSGSVSLFACLCGARVKQGSKNPPRESPEPDNKQGQQPASGITYKTFSPSESHRTEYEVQALLQLQRFLGGLRGAWLPRAQAVLSSIGVFFNAADVSFFGASGAGNGGSQTCFVLLARESTDVQRGCKVVESAPMAGFEVWPSSESSKREGRRRGGDPRKVPSVASTAELESRGACQRLMPSMLDRMLVTQAPVIESFPACLPCGPALGPYDPRGASRGGVSAKDKPADSTRDIVALVPLFVGDRIAGALWIARYGNTTTMRESVGSSQCIAAASPASMQGCGSGGIAATAIPMDTAAAADLGNAIEPQAPCPALLSSAQALQLLGIGASMCLLGSERDLPAGLCESLHQLSTATNMHQLVGGLCEALSGHMRERFLLEPRVFAALVPDAASAVGLMFSKPCIATPAISRTATKLSRLASSGGIEAASLGECHRNGNRPLSPGVIMMNAKDTSIGTRTRSDNVLRSLAQDAAVAAAATAAAVTVGTCGCDGFQDRDGGTLHRTQRMPGMQRVVPLAQADLALVDAALGPSGGNGAATSGAAASGSFLALRAKPFPLAQTLLHHLMRKVTATAGASAAACRPSSFDLDSSGKEGCGGGSLRRGGFRTHAVEVEDCAQHLQDPKKPSRDILLLIANSGAGAPQNPSVPGSVAGVGCAGLPGSGSNNFMCGRRTVSSLVLLVLPAGEGKAMLGLYVTFPQTLPQQLLQQARSNLQEILEVLSPVVDHKLSTELGLELGTLATAAPGSYAVLGAPEVDPCTTVVAHAVDSSAGDPNSALRASRSKLIPETAGDTGQPAERVVSMHSALVQSFFSYDSRGGGGGGPGSGTIQGGAGSSVITGTRSLNLMDTTAPVEHTADMPILLSVPECDLAAASHHPAMNTDGEVLTPSTVIHLEELDMVQSSLRAQMPLLVASMQNSINHARLEAAVMAAAACTSSRPGGRSLASVSQSIGADHSDLAQLTLQIQLGIGGCAVVFKGTLGTLDCAIKLMEMPDVDGTETTGTSRCGMMLNWAADANSRVNSWAETNNSDRLAARRTLLRNAMELAAMTSISHPNIMQVYGTFSNVTLGRRVQADGSEHIYLKTVDGNMSSEPDAPPICVAIVCEWCDKGCLGTALQKRTFSTLMPLHAGKRYAGQSSGSSGGGGLAKQLRFQDYKGILMTLLDVAMALRHLHSHHLIHCDFGFVTLLNQPGDEKSRGEPFAWVEETCGTVTHMAPEYWEKPTRLDASCDVYSFGILMWEMTSGGSRPYPEVPPSNIARAVKRGARPVFEDGVPAQYKHVAQKCWSLEPTSRPRTSELVAAISHMLSCM